MKFITPTVIVIGLNRGKIILKNKEKPVQPSITAASSNSLGNVVIYLVISIVEKGINIAEYTKTKEILLP